MTTEVRGFLDKHLQQKLANHDWLEHCLKEEPETDLFPYRPDEDGKPTISRSRPFLPRKESSVQVTPPSEPCPLFLANIPIGRPPSNQCDYSNYLALLRRIQDESFGTTPEKSAQAVKKRLAIVLGINQIESIDPQLNRTFKKFITDLPKIKYVASRTIGFFWKPAWKKHLGPKPKKSKAIKKWEVLKDRVYPLKKAFLLLKVLSSSCAEEVRKAHEQPEGLAASLIAQIPFQRIRETIKNSRSTQTFMEQMEKAAPRSPIYYTIMDADCLSLRPSRRQEGIFSRLGALIDEHDEPSIASLGYSLKDDELPLLRLAVKMDMAIRSTMPMPYFPEPCTVFKVRTPQTKNFLESMSFIGEGKGLESRRFIQNGQKKLKDGAVFKGDGGVVTATPSRMKTDYNQNIQALTTAVLKKKRSLQALRGRTLQTHAFPKQWADILYAGLPFSCSQVTDATTPMMHIFSVYDPISRMFNTQRYSSGVFDQVIRDYTNPLTDAQENLIYTARAHLLNLKMKKEMVDLVEETAKLSGKAIYRILEEAVQA